MAVCKSDMHFHNKSLLFPVRCADTISHYRAESAQCLTLSQVFLFARRLLLLHLCRARLSPIYSARISARKPRTKHQPLYRRF